MADLNSRWPSIRQLLCCCAGKDAAPHPQQQQSDNSNPENIPDQPVQTPLYEAVAQILNLPRWEDRDMLYKRRIHDLEQELTEALKNRMALSHHLYELGFLVFPEMDPRDSTSPDFVENLKVYLESVQLERQWLEKRALWAEQTVREIMNEVSDLEKLLHTFGYCGTRRMERWCTPDGLPVSPPLPSQPFRYFSKIPRKSPENKAAAQSPGTLAEETFGELAPPKRNPVKEELAKSPWISPSKPGSMEAKSCVPPVKRVIFTEPRLPQTASHSGAGSCWPPPEHSQCSTARASVGYGDTCVAQDYGHWDPHLEREQEGLAQYAEDGSLGTTSTLLVATPSVGGSEDIKISPDSSVSLDINPTLQKSKMERCNIWSEKQPLATMEGDWEIKRHGEGSTGKEEECVTLGSISLKSVGTAGQVPKNLSDAQTDPQKLDGPKAKTFQDLPGHATLQTEVSFPGKDSPKSGQSQSIGIVHSSNQTAGLEPEQVSRSLDLLQKLEKELSSLELTLKADLPSSSIKAVETSEPLGEKRVLDDAPGVNSKTSQPIPMEENATVDFPLRPEELLPSDLYDALTSVSLESPPPSSFMAEVPSNFPEETAVEEN